MKIHPSERLAIALARQNGGKLHRNPNNTKWSLEKPEENTPRFNSTTITGLVKKGLSRYSGYKTGPHGSRYAIEITLTLASEAQ